MFKWSWDNWWTIRRRNTFRRKKSQKLHSRRKSTHFDFCQLVENLLSKKSKSEQHCKLGVEKELRGFWSYRGKVDWWNRNAIDTDAKSRLSVYLSVCVYLFYNTATVQLLCCSWQVYLSLSTGQHWGELWLPGRKTCSKVAIQNKSACLPVGSSWQTVADRSACFKMYSVQWQVLMHMPLITFCAIWVFCSFWMNVLHLSSLYLFSPC